MPMHRARPARETEAGTSRPLDAQRGAAGDEGVGFLRDERRLNVALTRAKHGCIVIGREATLRTDARWRGLLDACAASGGLVDVASSDAALELLGARGAPVLGKRRREEAEDGELEDVGIL